jgi:hypothetical protein
MTRIEKTARRALESKKETLCAGMRSAAKRRKLMQR